MPMLFASGSRRRRPSLFGAGLIALALWVQALAPLGALQTMLAEPADLPLGILCGHGPDDPASIAAVDQPGQGAHPCALCQLCCAGLASPPLPSGPALANRVRWHAVAWPIPPPVCRQAECHRSTRARAPPQTA
jgi:hypothetical protein